MPRIRSMLFVPGNRPDRIAKAVDCGADAVIVDLQDAVPPEERPAARDRVVEALARPASAGLFVRISEVDGPDALRDLLAVVRPGLSGIVIPEVTGADDVKVVDRVLGWLEADRGLPAGRITIVPILETATAIRDARQLCAASPRVAYAGGIAPKGGDVENAIGYRWSPGGRESFVLRSQALLDVRAAGVPNPITGLWTAVDDLDGLRSFAEESRSLGYEGMYVIHPSHVPVVHAAFDLLPGERDYYEGLLRAMDDATGAGTAAIRYRGQMVDLAMVRTARAVLGRD